MRSPVSRVAAAVIFVLAIAGVALWFHGGGATVSFAQVVEQFLKVKSYKLKITDQVRRRNLAELRQHVDCSRSLSPGVQE